MNTQEKLAKSKCLHGGFLKKSHLGTIKQSPHLGVFPR